LKKSIENYVGISQGVTAVNGF